VLSTVIMIMGMIMRIIMVLLTVMMMMTMLMVIANKIQEPESRSSEKDKGTPGNI